MEVELVKKFAFDREIPLGVSSGTSRPGRVPEELDFDQLCAPEDLLPPSAPDSEESSNN